MAAAYEPPVSDDRGPLTIRPSWRSLGRWEIHIVLAFLVAIFVIFAKINAIYSSRFVAVIAGILVLYLAYQALYMVGSRIVVTADSILVTHWFTSTARVPCREIARVVRLSLKSSMKDNFPRPAVFAFSADGRCVLSLFAERWSKDDLDRIWRHLGITAEGAWEAEILSSDLRSHFPGAF